MNYGKAGRGYVEAGINYDKAGVVDGEAGICYVPTDYVNFAINPRKEVISM